MQRMKDAILGKENDFYLYLEAHGSILMSISSPSDDKADTELLCTAQFHFPPQRRVLMAAS
jgi:hypothetical protein